MISAVDTNVLLDILLPNQEHLEWSLQSLSSIGRDDELVVCEVVFAELASQFLSLDDLQGFLSDTGIRLLPSTMTALNEAASAWKKYSAERRGGIVCPSCGLSRNMVCDSCGKTINVRQHILSDFWIGGHAKIQAERLITRDRGFYRGYFRGLKLLSP